MKKKLIATLVAGAVLSASLVSLTACGGGLSINKGEEVDEAGWKAAYTATLEAKNFTIDSYTEETVKMKGSMEEFGLDSIDMTVKSTAEGKIYYDLENSTNYTKGTSKVSVSGVPDELKDKYENEEYTVETYSVKDGDTLYSATYYGYQEDPEWNVYSSPASLTVSSGSPLSYYLGQSFATEEGGEAKKVNELYSAFTYKSGVYSATLWQSNVEIKVSVSIKGGYVVGFSYEGTYTQEDEESGSSYSEGQKSVYNISNYGSTTVSASDAAKKAVEDYKASQN